MVISEKTTGYQSEWDNKNKKVHMQTHMAKIESSNESEMGIYRWYA